jgi:hypothetical protein
VGEKTPGYTERRNLMNIKLSLSQDDDTDIVIRLTMRAHGKWYTWPFTFSAHSGGTAALLFDKINEEFKKRIQQIRETAYEQGRMDARRHVKKLRHFNGCFDEVEVGW